MFYFNSKGKRFRLPVQQIIYAEIYNHDLCVYTNGWGTVHIRMTLSAFLEKMPDTFMRVHNSYVINTDFLMGVGYRECIVAGNVTIPVTKATQEEMEQIFIGEMK